MAFVMKYSLKSSGKTIYFVFLITSDIIKLTSLSIDMLKLAG